MELGRKPQPTNASQFLIAADGSSDLALITRYTGIHSSPDPFVILETGNKHTHIRHARQLTPEQGRALDLGSVRPRAAETPRTRGESGSQKTAQGASQLSIF